MDLSPIDLARLEIFRRVCFRRVGATPDSPGMVAAAPAAVAPPPAPIAGTGTPRKLKMSAIVDQTLDAEVQPLEHAEVTNMYQSYQAKYGAAPSPESEPTADQLAAVRQLVSSGSSPYIDMAVYGFQGLRRLRKLTFASYSLNSMGEWARKEMPGRLTGNHGPRCIAASGRHSYSLRPSLQRGWMDIQSSSGLAREVRSHLLGHHLPG